MSDDEFNEFQGYGSPKDSDNEIDSEDEEDPVLIKSRNRKNIQEMTLAEILRLGVSTGFPSPENQRERLFNLFKINGIDEKLSECPAPLELLYDENYSREKDFMMKYEKAKEYKKYYSASSNSVMNEVVSNWEFDKKVATYFLKGVFRFSPDGNLPERLSKEQLELVLNKLSGCGIELPLETPPEEYNWITQWKQITLKGGRGVVVDKKNPLFRGHLELETYRQKISASFNKNRNVNLYRSQIADITPNEVLPPSKLSITYLVKSQTELNFENNNVRRIGQVVVRPAPATRGDYEQLVRDIKNNPYDTDRFINDVSGILRGELTKPQRDSLERKLKDKPDKSLVYLSELFSGIKLTNPDPLDEPDRGVRGLSLLMSQIELTQRPELHGIEDPLSSGVKKTNGIVHSDYRDIEFIQPYRDPHFTFIGGVAETWVPLVHMVTGLPVFTKKAELKNYTVLGSVVYLKLQETSVKVDNNKTVSVMYFRKFLDFNDYLKSWQETYVRKFLELELEYNSKITDKIDKKFIDTLSRHISYRDKYLRRIRDIRNYFLKLLSGKEKGNEKLKIYVADEVVEEVLVKNNDELLKYVWELKEKLKDELNKLYGNNSPDLLEIVRIKRIMKYFLRFFPDDLFGFYSKVSSGDKKLFGGIKQRFSVITKQLQEYDQQCNSQSGDFITLMNAYEKLFNEYKDELSLYTPVYSFMGESLPEFKRTCSKETMEKNLIEFIRLNGDANGIQKAIDNGFYNVAFECVKANDKLNKKQKADFINKILTATNKYTSPKHLRNEEQMRTVLLGRHNIREYVSQQEIPGVELCSPEEVMLKEKVDYLLENKRKFKLNSFLEEIQSYINICSKGNKKI